jgi:hypothetical protein
MSSRVVLLAIHALLAAGFLAFLAEGPVCGQAKKPGDSPAAKNLAPKLVTLPKQIALSQALKELARQTDNAVEDRRQDRTEIQLKLNLDKVTFWQALDAIAKEADLRLSLYGDDRKVALVEGPYREVPVSYAGLFRVAVKRIEAVQNLEAEEELARFTRVFLEVAWEPRFRGFLLESRPGNLVVQDDKGRPRQGPDVGRGQIPVGGKVAEEIQLIAGALPRSSAQIGLLKGNLSMVGSPKMLEFSFGKMDAFKPGLEQKKEGVSATWRKFTRGEETWSLEFGVTYPPGGPELESFQNSLFTSEVYLEKGGKRFAHNGNESIDVGRLLFFFEDEPEKKFRLGKPADWTLVLQVPGPLTEVPIPFTFKDVPLP